jgi:hypothetical protein
MSGKLQRRVWRLLCCALILGVLLALGVGWRDCRASGGHSVRGLFWMECLR